MTVAPHIEDDVLVVTDENFADLLLESAGQALAIERGEMQPARKREYPRMTIRATVPTPPPPMFDPGRIRRVREGMGVSQSVFARALNVSDKTVKAWEQGKNPPKGATLRLLEIIEKKPGTVFPRLNRRRKLGK